jgi:hypothetical protein
MDWAYRFWLLAQTVQNLSLNWSSGTALFWRARRRGSADMVGASGACRGVSGVSCRVGSRRVVGRQSSVVNRQSNLQAFVHVSDGPAAGLRQQQAVAWGEISEFSVCVII